ncbi:hypothetical protein TeGR_g11017, partial [Tetraparma gracilis]
MSGLSSPSPTPRATKLAPASSIPSSTLSSESSLLASISALAAKPDRDLPALLSALGSLSALSPQPPPSSLLAKPAHYSLLFASSSAALSSIGTGLHELPLARMDALFLSVAPPRVTIQEVVRLIGPFPNVLNTISGTGKVEKGVAKLEYTSVVDGTGRELVGSEPRLVETDVFYCSRGAL